MSSTSPGVLLLCDFVQASAAKGGGFAGYLMYQDRPEAFEVVKSFDGEKWEIQEKSKTPGTANESNFSGYMDYQDRDKAKSGIGIQTASQDPLSVTAAINGYYRSDDKSDGLFDSKNDRITGQEKDWYRSAYNLAQSTSCPLYRGVISFDNDFLREQGLMFDSDIDKRKLKDITRSAVATLVDKSHLQATDCVWTAAIHYNTDNIHVHFSLIEERKHNRRKDMLPLEAIDAAKSKIVNQIIGSEQAIIRTKLLREDLLPSVKNTYQDNGSVLIALMDQLPKGIKWEYNRRTFSDYTGLVDQAVDRLIASDPESQAAFNRYSDLLQENALLMRKAYGDGNRHLWEDFAPERMRDFYSRAGNSLLEELQTCHEIDPDALSASGNYSLDQISAIREGLRNGVDVMAIVDNDISGAECWTYLRLQQANCDDALLQNIMARTDPHLQDLSAWVCESGADPSLLLQAEYTPEQLTVLAIALRHRLDTTKLSDPNLAPHDREREFNRLAADAMGTGTASPLKSFDFEALKIVPGWGRKTAASAVAAAAGTQNASGKAGDINTPRKSPQTGSDAPHGAKGKAGDINYTTDNQRRFAPLSASPARCRSTRMEFDKSRQHSGYARGVNPAALAATCRTSSRRLQRDYQKRLKQLEREFDQQQQSQQRSMDR